MSLSWIEYECTPARMPVVGKSCAHVKHAIPTTARDKSDALAFVANKSDAVSFNKKDTGFDKLPTGDVESRAPETSSNTKESKASIIFIKSDVLYSDYDNYVTNRPEFINGTSIADYAGGLIFHGSGHNATLNHSYVGLGSSADKVDVDQGVYGLGDERALSFMATPFTNARNHSQHYDINFNQLMSRMTPEQRKIYLQKFNSKSRNTLGRKRK